MITLDIIWQGERDGTLAALFARVARCCAQAEGLGQACRACVTVTDDAQIHALNREKRGVDRATDVLSFPTVRYPAGKTAAKTPALLRREYDAESRACFLGDIVISRDHARAQAAAYGHSVRREMAYLLAHGLFHLMGYDHMESEDYRKMREKEEKALGAAGIGRVTDEELLARAREMLDFAYAPYSKYRVGACLLAEDGRLFTGCNVENSSYGVTNCAERTAVFKAVSEGARRFTAIAIAAEKAAPWPCGACRQALSEFADAGMRVLVTWDGGKTDVSTLGALLPHVLGDDVGNTDFLGRD